MVTVNKRGMQRESREETGKQTRKGVGVMGEGMRGKEEWGKARVVRLSCRSYGGKGHGELE